MLKFVARAIAALALAALALAAQAQTWPAAPVRIIIPFPPGGTTDQIARLLAPHLQQSLGQAILVENRGGASGSIGANVAAKSAPDGYTFLIVFDTHAVNPSLIPNLPYDTLKDLAPIMLIGTSPMVITAHPGTSYKNFGDLIAASKAKPNSVAYGTIGAGSLAHLAMTLYGDQLKVDMTHVPYKGGGPLVTDALAGHVPVAIATVALLSSNIAAGKLRPLAVTSAQRFPQLPNVPTLIEQGVTNVGTESWWGLLAPAGTPAPILARMHEEVAKALKIPAVQERLTQQGVVLRVSSPEEFGKFLSVEIERWGKVVRDSKISAGG
jgi:tripartite-type tricarboxylate transporter receptor subunit TctC